MNTETEYLKSVIHSACGIIHEYLSRDIDASMKYKDRLAAWESGLLATSTPIDEWFGYGVEMGYCSEPVCTTHEGLPTTEEEDAEWEEGFDPCSVGVRLWTND